MACGGVSLAVIVRHRKERRGPGGRRLLCGVPRSSTRAGAGWFQLCLLAEAIGRMWSRCMTGLRLIAGPSGSSGARSVNGSAGWKKGLANRARPSPQGGMPPTGLVTIRARFVHASNGNGSKTQLIGRQRQDLNRSDVSVCQLRCLRGARANRGLLSGEGGTGKSITEMMKDVAHVAGKDWLGSMTKRLLQCGCQGRRRRRPRA